MLALPAAAGVQDGRLRTAAVELESSASAARPGVVSQLVPVQAEDLVWVASALRLFALDARTLGLRWSAGPPEGWSGLGDARRAEILEGLDHEFAWTMPGVGEQVVAAVLLLPFAREERLVEHGRLLATLRPERRLFAYARVTGEPLWDHAPPGPPPSSGGEFALRMNLIGPPLVAGALVLVPCASDESSIDYRIAAYELASGRLAWSTFVQRGQVQRTPLGHVLNEFTAPPLVLAPGGGHVLALTGLGTVALLDARTGELGWSTSYPVVPLPPAHAIRPPRRSLRWRSTPPVVVGDVVLAAPMDSRALLAFDLVDGRLLWSLADIEEFAHFSCRSGSDHLAGAEGDTLYLGGPELAALRCVGGLRAPLRWELTWTLPEVASGARSQLANGIWMVPDGPGRLLEIEACSGVERRVHAADASLGLLVREDALFALGTGGLTRLER